MSRDVHASPSGNAQEPLYDVNVATPTHAERARTLAQQIRTATLCTVAMDPPGYPYGSFVTLAFDAGRPVFLISELAEHTKNLRRDPRASVLIAEARKPDPLANGRVTLLGECQQVTDGDTARAAYLQAHPDAGYYADFRDFSFWRLAVQSIRYIGGYGRMSWVTREDWLDAEPDPLAPHASGIVEHMNEDHGDALVAYCRAFSRAGDIETARMTDVDRYGFEMSATTKDGPRPVRLAFPDPVSSPTEARQALIAMVKEARARLA